MKRILTLLCLVAITSTVMAQKNGLAIQKVKKKIKLNTKKKKNRFSQQ